LMALWMWLKEALETSTVSEILNTIYARVRRGHPIHF
jgi:hypothetical protein